MKLDLRQPMAVIAGAFNAAIFVPSWIANTLYQIPEGEDVNVVMVGDMVQGTSRPYIQSTAILAEDERLSLFIDCFEKPCVALGESLLDRLGQTLPHTPIAGLGINFRFIFDELDEAVYAMMKQNDGPEVLGQLVRARLVSEIKLEDAVSLNLRREILNDELVVDFNYHHRISHMSELNNLVGGKILTKFEESKAIVHQLYGIEITNDIAEISALNREES